MGIIRRPENGIRLLLSLKVEEDIESGEDERDVRDSVMIAEILF